MLTSDQKYKPVKVDFPAPVLKEMDTLVEDNIRDQDSTWSPFHQNLDKLSDLYEGKPREEIKSFPWRNASNIVIQVVGQHVDTLKAALIGSIYELDPVWPVSVLGDWDDQEDAEGQRQVLEEFMNFVGLEPEKLDFYRVESLWAADMLKYGIGVIKAPLDESVEQTHISIGGTDPIEKPLLKYFGPAPEKIILRNFTATITAPTLEKASFKKVRITLKKQDLLARKYQNVYDAAVIDDLLTKPDRGGPTPEQIEEYNKQNISIGSQIANGAEWDIDECWFEFWHNEKKHRIIQTYHLASKKTLRRIFNFYPDNEEPFIMARLGWDRDGLLGKGFAELLRDYQEEISTGHNQRVDNRTLANCAIIRVPKNGRFDSHFSFYPGMTIPADQGELEPMQVGVVYPDSVNEEMTTLKLAEDRSGVGINPSGTGGMGSGTVGKTTGAYSSMGTYAVLQNNGKRVNANITDFKYAHIKAGRLFAKMYAHFGTNGEEAYFGNKRELILKAFDSYIKRKLGFGIGAATASINRETERQNLLLLSGVMQRHYTAIGQMLQAITNQQINPTVQQYLMDAIKGADLLQARILRAFAIDDRERLVPKPKLEGVNNGGSSEPPAIQPGMGTNQEQQGNGSEPLPDTALEVAGRMV